MQYLIVLSFILLTACSQSKSPSESTDGGTPPVVTPGKTCLYYGSSVLASESVSGFLTSSVPYGQVCQRITATCNGTTGTLSSTPVPFCTVLPPKNCSYYGSVYIVGSTITGFASATVPYGQTCQQITATCDGGSGQFSATPELTCTVLPARTCTFNGQTYNEGTQISGFTSSTVPFGQTCTAVTGVCDGGSGQFSSTPSAMTCEVEAPSDCDLNGTLIPHQDSVTTYLETVASTKFCDEGKEVRTCFNGVLSGSNQHLSCSENPMVLKISSLANAAHIVGVSKLNDAQTENLPRIDWGDGTFSEVAFVTNYSQIPTHTYSSAGEKTVRIMGRWKRDFMSKPFVIQTDEEPNLRITTPLFAANTSGSSYGGKLIEVISWGNNPIDSFNAIFATQSQLVSLPVEPPNLSQVTDLSVAFYYAINFNQPLNWNTENVTLMHGTFWAAQKFNQPLNWDTSKVITMKEMFNSAVVFNQPINFDTSNVQIMTGMFSKAYQFNQPLNFNTSKVTNLDRMFNYAQKFNQDLSTWCLPLISIYPTDLDTYAIMWQESFKPVLENCPNP